MSFEETFLNYLNFPYIWPQTLNTIPYTNVNKYLSHDDPACLPTIF